MRGPSPALHGTAVFPAVPRASCCWFTGDALQRVSKHMRKPLCALWVVRVRTCSVEQAQRDVARAQSVAGFSVLRFSFLVPVFVRFGSFFACIRRVAGVSVASLVLTPEAPLGAAQEPGGQSRSTDCTRDGLCRERDAAERDPRCAGAAGGAGATALGAVRAC